MKISKVFENMEKKNNEINSITILEKNDCYKLEIFFFDINNTGHCITKKYKDIEIDIETKYFSPISREEFCGPEHKGKFFQTLYYEDFYINIYVTNEDNKNLRR